MKRFAAWMLILTMALGLCACGEAPAEVTEAPETEPVVQAPVEEPVELVTEEFMEGQLSTGMEMTYYVTVNDQNGNPVPGVTVVLDSELCTPCDTNELGVATFVMSEAQYTATIENLPFGYDYATDYREFPFEQSATYLTIVVNLLEEDTGEMDIADEEPPMDEIVEDVIPEG